MKKKINKKDIPGYAFGASEVGIGTVLGGAASGAGIGTSIMPGIGTAIGAVAGGLLGAVGTGGSVDPYTGLITNPSGIAGLFGRSKSSLRAESNRIKTGNLNKQLTLDLRSNYYINSMAEYNPNTFAQGGTVGIPATVRVSDNELIENPFTHEITEMPGNGLPNGKDDKIVTVPIGSSITSNKRHDMDKKLTNAAFEKKFIKPNKKITDKYSEGTVNAQKLLHNIIINTQEEAKNKQTIGKYAGGTPYVQLGKDPIEKDLFNPIINPDIEDELAARKANAARKATLSKLTNILPQIGQLAAPIINIAKGKQKVQPVVARTMTPTYARTTVDNRPLLRLISKQGAIGRYNASQSGNDNPAFLTLLSLNQMDALSNVWSDTYNKEITLANNNAAVSNRFKEHNANAQHTADIEYAQNLAAGYNMWSTGVGQLGKAIGGIGRDRRGDRNNTALAFALSPYLRQGMVNKDVDRLLNILEYA